MRYPRLKIRPAEGECYYHLMSRTVNGEHLFGELEKEMLTKQIYKVAEYCGIEVTNCASMINHFHITARVPKLGPVTDAELLRRYAVLHSSTSKWQVLQLEGSQGDRLDKSGLPAH